MRHHGFFGAIRRALSSAGTRRRRPGSVRPGVELLEERALLSFRPAALYPVVPAGPAPGTPQAVATGDVNGDRVDDLVVLSGGTAGALSVLVGNGDGTFQ